MAGKRAAPQLSLPPPAPRPKPASLSAVAADAPAASLLSARASQTPPQTSLLERGERPASLGLKAGAGSAEMDLGAEAFYFPPDRVPWLIGSRGAQLELLRKLCHDLGCCVGALAETSRSEKSSHPCSPSRPTTRCSAGRR
jgi:hypothetical protein